MEQRFYIIGRRVFPIESYIKTERGNRIPVLDIPLDDDEPEIVYGVCDKCPYRKRALAEWYRAE